VARIYLSRQAPIDPLASREASAAQAASFIARYQDLKILACPLWSNRASRKSKTANQQTGDHIFL